MRQYLFLGPRHALNEAPTLWAGPTEGPVCPSHADDVAEFTLSRNIEVRGPGRQCRPQGVGGKKRDHRHHSFSDQHRSRARPLNFPQAEACSISRGWNAVEFCVFSWNLRTRNSQASSKRMSPSGRKNRSEAAARSVQPALRARLDQPRRAEIELVASRHQLTFLSRQHPSLHHR